MAARLNQAQDSLHTSLLEEMTNRNGRWFDTEMDKLDRWADDRRVSLQSELDELDESLKSAKRQARLAANLPDKLEWQRTVRTLETKRDEAWRQYDAASREIDNRKDSLLDEISRRLEQTIIRKPLFVLRWVLT